MAYSHWIIPVRNGKSESTRLYLLDLVVRGYELTFIHEDSNKNFPPRIEAVKDKSKIWVVFHNQASAQAEFNRVTRMIENG